MTTPEHTLLGRAVEFPRDYDSTLLHPIPRAAARAELGIADTLPFSGEDVWNAYELSWLDARGKPEVAIAEFRVPADSPNLIESKSWKLYLNSLAQTRAGDADALRATLTQDLSRAAGAQVRVSLLAPACFAAQRIDELDGESIDGLDVSIDHYGPPRPEFLAADADDAVEEALVSQLLKSNCPVTGQPDWASVRIAYAGPRIDRTGLLRYLVSYREHAGFHEACVERVFVDLLRRCAPTRLSVYARYTRRGGLDINPFRATHAQTPPNPRGARQ